MSEPRGRETCHRGSQGQAFLTGGVRRAGVRRLLCLYASGGYKIGTRMAFFNLATNSLQMGRAADGEFEFRQV